MAFSFSSTSAAFLAASAERSISMSVYLPALATNLRRLAQALEVLSRNFASNAFWRLPGCHRRADALAGLADAPPARPAVVLAARLHELDDVELVVVGADVGLIEHGVPVVENLGGFGDGTVFVNGDEDGCRGGRWRGPVTEAAAVTVALADDLALVDFAFATGVLLVVRVVVEPESDEL